MTDGVGGDRVGVLVMAHGTPRRIEDIEAFYTEIRRGRPPTPELLAELVGRYQAIGGTSPLNERTEAQTAAIAAALENLAPGRFVVEAGSKFSAPRIEDAAVKLRRAGVARVVGLVLTPQSSTASVGEYARRARVACEEDVPAETRAAGGGGRPAPVPIHVIDHWHTEPDLAVLLAERVANALDSLGLKADAGLDAAVIFTAHSIPSRLVDAGDVYADQVAETAAAVAKVGQLKRWSVAYQSAGRTEDPWLGPDVRDVIASLAASGAGAVVVCPIGFVSDHLEVLYDIDIEARAVAEKLGLQFARTASLDDDPRFCAMLARLVLDSAGAAGA